MEKIKLLEIIAIIVIIFWVILLIFLVWGAINEYKNENNNPIISYIQSDKYVIIADSVKFNASESYVEMAIKRKENTPEAKGFFLILEDITGASASYRINKNIKELETEKISINYDDSNLQKITKMVILPIFSSKEGLEITPPLTVVENTEITRTVIRSGGGRRDGGGGDRSESDSPVVVVAGECNDGKDNDGDGLIDYPTDLGCTDLNDNENGNKTEIFNNYIDKLKKEFIGYEVDVTPKDYANINSIILTIKNQSGINFGGLMLLNYTLDFKNDNVMPVGKSFTFIYRPKFYFLNFTFIGDSLFNGATLINSTNPVAASKFFIIKSSFENHVRLVYKNDWFDVLGTSDTVEVKKNQFEVYEDLIYQTKPNLSELYGIKHAMPIENVFTDWGKTSEPNILDESKTRNWTKYAKKFDYDLVYLDIEHWPIDIRGKTNAEVDETQRKFNQLMNWIHDEEPQLSVGVYAIPPLRDYWTPVSYYDALNHPNEKWYKDNLPLFKERLDNWTKANAFLGNMAGNEDVILPSLYVFYDNDPANNKELYKFELYAYGNIKEARKYGKPVIVFIWPQIHPQNLPKTDPLYCKYVSGEYFRTQLDVLRTYADGVVIWGAEAFLPGDTWNENSPWWVQTKDFVSNLRRE